MNFIEPQGIPIGDLPPCILNIKVRRQDVAHSAAVHAYQLAASEAKRPAAVRRPVFLVLNPQDYAKSEYLTATGNDGPTAEGMSSENAGASELPEAEHAEQHLIRVEASGLSFTMTTFEYLDAVVGKANRPIVVIDRYNQFVTQDGPRAHERVLDWAVERSGLVVAIRWPRSARRRHSA